MSSTTELTPRQREVLERLEQRMSAMEIAKDLGISRNAVYQQIQAIRRKGHLSPAYTPSGAKPRELGSFTLDVPAGEPLAVQLAALVAQTAAQLRALADQLEAHVGTPTNGQADGS